MFVKRIFHCHVCTYLLPFSLCYSFALYPRIREIRIGYGSEVVSGTLFVGVFDCLLQLKCTKFSAFSFSFVWMFLCVVFCGLGMLIYLFLFQDWSCGPQASVLVRCVGLMEGLLQHQNSTASFQKNYKSCMWDWLRIFDLQHRLSVRRLLEDDGHGNRRHVRSECLLSSWSKLV